MLIRKIVLKRKFKYNLKHIGRMGEGVFLDESLIINFPENLKIDSYVHMQHNCSLFAGGGISIGEGTIIAHEVQILSQNHVYDLDDLRYIPYDERMVNKPVVIGKYCWIGARVTILPGTILGKGVVVGAGSVVTGNFPDYAVIAGNPAKIIKYRNADVFEKLENEGKGYLKEFKKY